MLDQPDSTALTDLASHLRRNARDLVEEWEITESETEQGRLRKRHISDVWEQAMHRGDDVTVQATFGRISGSVDYVGADYATVLARDTFWDVRLGRCAMVARRSVIGGHTVQGGSRTFKARLAEYEATAEDVSLLVPSLALEVRGTIAVLATDHVIITGEEANAIPLGLIDAIRRRR